MTWIIASVPFWLLGAFFALIGTVGFCRAFADINSPSTDQQYRDFYIGMSCMVGGGLLLLLAAKIST